MPDVILNVEQIVMTCCRDPLQTCEAFRLFSQRNAAGD